MEASTAPRKFKVVRLSLTSPDHREGDPDGQAGMAVSVWRRVLATVSHNQWGTWYCRPFQLSEGKVDWAYEEDGGAGCAAY
ncbi:hypothetical protein NITHO_580002 [Nitrolancea hollandica Lb]|uniref:Uncharacterized protein n=1 Tax=Nitrolancea hollandica Lb TaxID=1129897 RepID=I4EMA4_9BACT|nr:hypothetical protein NITHO_580002 [Nitrolancea hollandica Lb]